MHRGRSSPGPPSASMRWLGGAPTRGPRRLRIIFIGDGDEAPDGGSPLVELFCSRRKVEEQLRARQSFCWRGWRRKLHGPWRASTSNHVRRSSITALRLCTIFASTSACMLAPFVLRRKRRTLTTAAPRVTSRAALLITHNLRRARRGRRCWCLGGRRTAVCGGWLVAWRTNDAAH